MWYMYEVAVDVPTLSKNRSVYEGTAYISEYFCCLLSVVPNYIHLHLQDSRKHENKPTVG